MSPEDRSERDPLQSLIADVLEVESRGESVDRKALIESHPEHADSLQAFFASHDQMRSAADVNPPRSSGPASEDPTIAPAASPLDDPTLSPTNPGGDDPTLPPSAAASRKGEPTVGDKVRYFGDYELLEEIARGGMGVVYKARQMNLNRIVALKMILAGQLAGDDDVQRFYTEAEAAASLDHPGIVPIFDIGEHAGQHYFSMSYIEGQSLAHRVADGPLPSLEAAELVMKVAEAMAYAHRNGVIHRDLKPANILVDKNGQPKVTDFGLAKKTETDSGLTGTGQILGTPAYMPPEQASGKTEQVSESSDVYSIGAILYALITGRPPFQAASPLDTLMQVIDQEPLSPTALNPMIDRDLETLCLKCLEKEPSRRYAAAEDLVAELNRYLTGEPILARSVSKPERIWRWCRRKPVLAGLWGSLLLLLVILAVGGPLVAVQQISLRRQADQAQQERALAQVESLLSASPDAVPFIVEELMPVYDSVLPALRSLQARDLTDKERTRVGLALLKDDPSHLDYLRQRLMDCDTTEYLLIRDSLAPFAATLADSLWRVAEDPRETKKRQFRAACDLGSYDADDERWQNIADQVVVQLTDQESLSAGVWVQALRPQKEHLLQPLGAIARDRSPELSTQRLLATSIFADYAADAPEQLVQLLVNADASQFTVLMPNVAKQAARSVELLREAIRDYDRSASTSSTSEQSASRCANAAIALVWLGAGDEIWPLFQHRPDPRLRSYLIHRLQSFAVSDDLLATQLKTQNDPGVVQALLLALATYSNPAKLDDLQNRLSTDLAKVFARDSDSGVHAAAVFLLQKLNGRGELASRSNPQQASDGTNQGWFVNSEGQTFVVIQPQEFLMGSPATEFGRRTDETQHRRFVARSYAIASREITVGEFQRFMSERVQSAHSYSEQHSPSPDCPQTSVTWYEAAEYCNWLSEKNGIPESEWCFIPNAEGHFAEGMRLADNYLERIGYRLPTESEWELACRSGSKTSRCYGDTPELLEHYAWYLSNALDRSWPVGTRHPNAYGLFDMHGNVWEWCADAPTDFPNETSVLTDAIVETGPVRNGEPRALRGGSYFYHHIYTRSALRNKEPVDARYYGIGVRPVRTLH